MPLYRLLYFTRNLNYGDILENHSAGNVKDKMLINTVLILKHPDNWRKMVEEYCGMIVIDS